ncbi:MAG: homoserine O-succinyltransferase MetA [Candidatus Acidiferrales bacterium]
MPLMADRGRIPDHFGANCSALSINVLEMAEAPRQCVRVGLINNMPDSALRDTESQFFKLLAAAAGDLPVHMSLYSLAEIPREERGRQHIARYYRGAEDLCNSNLDAIIVTGTEPRQADLRQEPYWNSLSAVLDWAETNTKSAVLSCLAAHAAVLHSDRIERRLLPKKTCGIFEQSIVRPHALTEGILGSASFPHSRWNEVCEAELAAAGYAILTRSAESGVDLFARKKRRSLFVHFQGHPEYGARTLLKEYRRDIGRYLRSEHDAYPTMPSGYFDSESAKLATNFQERARSNRDPELLADFPSEELARGLTHHWRPSALRIYGNWLQYVAARKIETPRLAAAASSGYRARPY